MKDKRTCPVCLVGKNERNKPGYEESPTCFHCNTCDFVECETDRDNLNESIEELVSSFRRRLKKFYEYSDKRRKRIKKKVKK